MSARVYRGKYPNRIHSFSIKSGVAHIVTNGGDKYTLAAKDNNFEHPKLGAEISQYKAVKMNPTRKSTVKRARTPAQKAATAKMLAANRAKKKAIGKAKASNPSRSVKPARKVARKSAPKNTVAVVGASKAPAGTRVMTSTNGTSWKTVSLFMGTGADANAKEYARALSAQKPHLYIKVEK